jgi:hypothetical protein
MAISLRFGGRYFLLNRALPTMCCPSRRQASQDAPGSVLVAIPEITAFIERCMVAAGTKPTHAKALADNLTTADYRGHFSHGLNRLGNVRDVNID